MYMHACMHHEPSLVFPDSNAAVLVYIPALVQTVVISSKTCPLLTGDGFVIKPCKRYTIDSSPEQSCGCARVVKNSPEGIWVEYVNN